MKALAELAALPFGPHEVDDAIHPDWMVTCPTPSRWACGGS